MAGDTGSAADGGDATDDPSPTDGTDTTDDEVETYTLTFVEEELKVECRADEYVLDAAMDAGLDLPYGCLEGLCSICGAKVEGEVDQSEGVMLTPDEIRAGYALLCITYPRSDLRIRTHEVP